MLRSSAVALKKLSVTDRRQLTPDIGALLPIGSVDMSKQDTILSQCEKAFLLEVNRKHNLGNRAEKIVAAVAVVTGFASLDVVKKIDAIWAHPIQPATGMAMAAFICLGLSILLALTSERIQPYLAYPTENKLIDDLRDEQIDEEAAKLLFSMMYVRAHDRNSKINDRRAKIISASERLLIIGFALATSSNIANIH